MKAALHHLEVRSRDPNRSPQYQICPGILVIEEGDDVDAGLSQLAVLGKVFGDPEAWCVTPFRTPDEWEAQIRKDWNIDRIVAQVEACEPYDDGLPGTSLQKMTVLGTLVNPSGKYYVPFACNNVGGDCKVCRGTGDIHNFTDDKGRCSRARLLDRLITPRMSHRYGFYADWPEVWKKTITRVRDIREQFGPTETCPVCRGHGSQSVADDEAWREAFEEILKPFNMQLETSEDEPTLYIVTKYVEKVIADE